MYFHIMHHLLQVVEVVQLMVVMRQMVVVELVVLVLVDLLHQLLEFQFHTDLAVVDLEENRNRIM